MKTVNSRVILDSEAFPLVTSGAREKPQASRPLVSLVVPAYNEAPIVGRNLATLCEYLETLEEAYRWEMIFVDDGSADQTGSLAEAFAKTRSNIQVIHHKVNAGVGQAFQTAFRHCRGDYIVTLDLDLSYSLDHIQILLEKIQNTKAAVVTASPYMKGGTIAHVPWLRRVLSVWANRFLSFTARGNISTLTSMVRAYEGEFLRTLDLKSTGMEINPEIIYKAVVLHSRIEEIPAQLDWGSQKDQRVKQRSRFSLRLLRHTLAVLLSGFLFRPVIFFILPGFLLLLLSIFANAWVLIHSYEHYQSLSYYPDFGVRLSAAVAAAFNQAPHTFVVGGMTLMLAIQLMSLGILSLQSKSYFEEIFHLGTTLYKQTRQEH